MKRPYTQKESNFGSTHLSQNHEWIGCLPLADFLVQARLDRVHLLRNVPGQPIFLHQTLATLSHYDVKQGIAKGCKHW